MKFQIRFVDKQGNGSFEHFDAQRNVEKKAAEIATAFIERKKEQAQNNGSFWPFTPAYRPHRTVQVWEYDIEKKEPKKGGRRFKLQLHYFQATYRGGHKVRNEWYEPMIEEKKKKEKI